MTGHGRRASGVGLSEEAAAAPEAKPACAENDALAGELVRLKRLGLLVDLVPLKRIRAAKLTRDRRASGDLDLADLKASLRAVGLSNPIRVEPDGEGGYELVQGLRRLSAFHELLAETGEPRWSTIPAGILAPGEGLAGLYRRMVDENMVRADVSFAEMAQLACAYADEAVEGCGSVAEAVSVLYASAGPQKRSYVRRFALLMMRLGKLIEHPAAIPRALGLELADRIEHDVDAQARLAASLRQVAGGPEAELAVMRAFLAQSPAAPTPPKRRGAPPRGGRQRVRLSVPGPRGEAICTAGDERVELRLPGRDLGAIGEARLRAAAAAFLATLDG